MKKIAKVLCIILSVTLLVSMVACGGNQSDLRTLNAIVFENQTVTYDGQSHSIEVDSLPDGVTATYNGNGKVNAGVYSVTVNLALNGKSIEKSATLTINKAVLTVKAKDALIYQGESDFGYEIQGFVNGETVEVLTELPSFVNDKTQAGEYVDYIKFSGGSATNYEFAYQSADLKILPIYSEYLEDGVEFIEFGEYPQTVVSDTTLLANLIQAFDEDKLDVSGYFVYNGQKYFKASASVMENVDDIIEKNIKFVDGTPIVNGEEYFFKVEPIKWRVISEDNGEYVLMSEKLIDTKEYNSSAKTEKDENNKEIYASNWELSDIRAWLNDEFYNMAFKSVHQPYTFEDATNNSSSTALYDRYANGNNTLDKVYLPSYSEIKDFDNSVLLGVTTDYARAMGAYMLYGETGYWWTRSPGQTGSPSGIYPSTGTSPTELANISVVAPNATKQVVLDKYNGVKNQWTCVRPFINFNFAD